MVRKDRKPQRIKDYSTQGESLIADIKKQDKQYNSEDYAGETQGILRIGGSFGEGCRRAPRRYSL